MKKLILLELNELNFDFISKYAAEGHLPHFNRFIKQHGICETTSETKYEELEPWIQWVSIHTGLPLAQHGVFRLGDIADSKHFSQIWEDLECKGVSVGAFSPINAANRLKNPAFFVPDPWTATQATGPFLVRKLAEAISQAVNDNARNKIALKSLFYLALGFLRYMRPSHGVQYFNYLLRSISSKWFRAVFLDLFLFDVFFYLWRKERPQFASFFLNGAAHLQHHYLFNSRYYSGKNKNPNWYVSRNADPILDIYKLYDRILGEILRECSDMRIMIATGLHQTEFARPAYYYRLKEHQQFIRSLDIQFVSVLPRMSRDFLIIFKDTKDCAMAERKLGKITDVNGIKIFDLENRSDNLFVTLTYSQEISKGFTVCLDGEKIQDFSRYVVFVAIKNAEHSGVGYFLDSTINAGSQLASMNICQIKHRILQFFGIQP